MRFPQSDLEIYLLGFLVAALFIGGIVFLLLRYDRKAFHERKKLEAASRVDLSGGRDVSAALGVQQSTGLRLEPPNTSQPVSRRDVY